MISPVIISGRALVLAESEIPDESSLVVIAFLMILRYPAIEKKFGVKTTYRGYDSLFLYLVRKERNLKGKTPRLHREYACSLRTKRPYSQPGPVFGWTSPVDLANVPHG